MSGEVMIAVDPHKASNTAAVLDTVTKTLIDTARFANSDEGYARLAGFARRWEDLRWAVEGCRGSPRTLRHYPAHADIIVRICAAAIRGSAQHHEGTGSRIALRERPQ